MGICKVQVKNKYKQLTCKFCLALGNRLTILGLPDIELLDILNIKCSKIDTAKETKRSMNRKWQKCNTDENSNAILITSDNHDCLAGHFLPGPHKEADRKCNTNKNSNANPAET